MIDIKKLSKRMKTPEGRLGILETMIRAFKPDYEDDPNNPIYIYTNDYEDDVEDECEFDGEGECDGEAAAVIRNEYLLNIYGDLRSDVSPHWIHFNFRRNPIGKRYDCSIFIWLNEKEFQIDIAASGEEGCEMVSCLIDALNTHLSGEFEVPIINMSLLKKASSNVWFRGDLRKLETMLNGLRGDYTLVNVTPARIDIKESDSDRIDIRYGKCAEIKYSITDGYCERIINFARQIDDYVRKISSDSYRDEQNKIVNEIARLKDRLSSM